MLKNEKSAGRISAEKAIPGRKKHIQNIKMACFEGCMQYADVAVKVWKENNGRWEVSWRAFYAVLVTWNFVCSGIGESMDYSRLHDYQGCNNPEQGNGGVR